MTRRESSIFLILGHPEGDPPVGPIILQRMKSNPLHAALPTAEALVEAAREVCRQMEAQEEGAYQTRTLLHEPETVLRRILTNGYELVALLLEAARLPDSRQRFLGRWSELERSPAGLGTTRYDQQHGHVESRPLQHLAAIVDALRALGGGRVDQREADEVARLESMLRRCGELVHGRGVLPASERDVELVMHDYLAASFSDYSTHISTAAKPHGFRPDCAIRGARAAVAFEFADGPVRLAQILGSVLHVPTDATSTTEWVRFYTVVYQTSEFETDDVVRSQFSRTGVFVWKAILVTGARRLG
jgi:hypothetical protein